MKNKQLSILVCAILSAALLCSCGTSPQATPDSSANQTTEAEANETSETPTADDSAEAAEPKQAASTDDSDKLRTSLIDLEAPHDYTYTERITYEDYERDDNNGYDLTYALDLIDDSKAILREFYVYSPEYISENFLSGSYEKDGNEIYFSQGGDSESDNNTNYLMEINDENVMTNVTYIYADKSLQKLAGIYTCPSSDYGPLKLEITKFGQAKVTFDSGKTYSAEIMTINNKYDLMVYSDEDDISIDWYIYFSGTTFTHEPYYSVDYEDYAGTYSAFGNLGDIQFVVDSEGSVYSDIEIDGEIRNFYGSLYIDQEASTITGLYLYSDEGYALSLDLVFIIPDGWNYSGYLTTPLGAG